ncbi:hypothetical protein GCM10009616_06880 [Microlunatus lacustris]
MIVALLFYNDEARFAAMTVAERNALVERHIAFNTTVLQPRALMMVNRALQPTPTARTVWPTAEGAEVTEGPFDRPGLSLSGFYLIDCTDLDEATELAARYPMPLGMGCVEVRPALQGWDYAPSMDLDATRPEWAWELYADVGRWADWMPGVDSAVLDGACVPGAEGRLQLTGQPAARLRVVDAEPSARLSVLVSFPGGDAELGLEYRIEPLPRGAVRLTHRATVPRALLDTVGTDFSGRLNADLRGALRAAAARVRLIAQPAS